MNSKQKLMARSASRGLGWYSDYHFTFMKWLRKYPKS